MGCSGCGELSHLLVYGFSDNRWRIWGIDYTGREIGFGLEDDVESWRSGSGR